MASTVNAVFLSVSAATIFSPYVGDSERAIRDLFKRARNAAPAILFIDEIGNWDNDNLKYFYCDSVFLRCFGWKTRWKE